MKRMLWEEEINTAVLQILEQMEYTGGGCRDFTLCLEPDWKPGSRAETP